MNSDFNPGHSLPPVHQEETPDRPVAILRSKVDNIPTDVKYETSDVWFAPDQPMQTQFGYGEGYYRHHFETPETIKWKSGEAIYEQGTWKQPEFSVSVPWPLKFKPDSGAAMPEYLNEFVHKLGILQSNLGAVGSVLPADLDQTCCLCEHVMRMDIACHYLLSLQAFDPPTEMRWPSLYMHYITRHGVIPSKMFATILLERAINVPNGVSQSMDYTGSL
jgi:hypothetical protein